MRRLANALIRVLRRRAVPDRSMDPRQGAAPVTGGSATSPPSERSVCWHLD